MNKEEYIKMISGVGFWVRSLSENLVNFSGYVNEHPEMKIRDFIKIAACGNYPEFLGVIIDKFGPAAFTPEDGKTLTVFKGYHAPMVANIVIERGLALDVLKAYRDRLADELSLAYNFDRGNLMIAFNDVFDAIMKLQFK